ncbi:hypothetical protein SAMN05216167_102447 [Spirosoma endophyticum]|uniref:Uncharacterized protein n=1 Tax=Spirosoma endophyticum TaxID=662367 RepID=A0A1I1M5P3_9BACT|nr:hypothetical protein SAMN05216167_102447 [Spirosoma endophyticum]
MDKYLPIYSLKIRLTQLKRLFEELAIYLLYKRGIYPGYLA